MAKGLTSEDLLIKNINTTINKINNRKNKPSDDMAETERRFTRLKPLNIGMHDELLTKYNKAVLCYERPSDVVGNRDGNVQGNRNYTSR